MDDTPQTNLVWYILFHNHTQGLQLNTLLKDAGLKPIIVPTPRKLSQSCGIALMIPTDQLVETKAVIEREQAEILGIAVLPRDLNPLRDRYC